MTHPHDAEAPPCSIMIVRVAEDDQSQNKPVMARPATCSAGANLIMFGDPIEANNTESRQSNRSAGSPGEGCFAVSPRCQCDPTNETIVITVERFFNRAHHDLASVLYPLREFYIYAQAGRCPPSRARLLGAP